MCLSFNLDCMFGDQNKNIALTILFGNSGERKSYFLCQKFDVNFLLISRRALLLLHFEFSICDKSSVKLHIPVTRQKMEKKISLRFAPTGCD